MEIKDLAGLSEPVTKFIECCSNALGAIAHPWQIERVANAETKAEIIKAKGEGQVAKIKWQSESELSEMQQRAMRRVIHQEERKQQTIEAVIEKAKREVKEDAKPEEVDPDWYSYFFRQMPDMSDQEMQDVWARLLVGEVNQPGTFSRRTLTFLSDLDKKHACKFLLLCRFSGTINFTPLHPLIYNINHKIFANAGLEGLDIIDMQGMGL